MILQITTEVRRLPAVAFWASPCGSRFCDYFCMDAEPPTANPDKYADELLDAYLIVEDADALYAEYAAQGAEFTRGLGNMPWHRREFMVKDCDGRLLAFGANL
jgi:uncharacterized glyoxalase superfamily protein PhnB